VQEQSTDPQPVAPAAPPAPPAEEVDAEAEDDHDSLESDSDQGPEGDDPETDNLGVTSVKSLCMNCYKQGVTKLFMTAIPFFRDVILMSFRCPHCGYRSSEIQQQEMQEKGCRYEVLLDKAEVVKSDKASVEFPDLDFTIPHNTQAGVFTT
ncbi:Zpr1, partial [Symbiodinium sp. KB8]